MGWSRGRRGPQGAAVAKWCSLAGRWPLDEFDAWVELTSPMVGISSYIQIHYCSFPSSPYLFLLAWKSLPCRSLQSSLWLSISLQVPYTVQIQCFCIFVDASPFFDYKIAGISFLINSNLFVMHCRFAINLSKRKNNITLFLGETSCRVATLTEINMRSRIYSVVFWGKNLEDIFAGLSLALLLYHGVFVSSYPRKGLLHVCR